MAKYCKDSECKLPHYSIGAYKYHVKSKGVSERSYKQASISTTTATPIKPKPLKRSFIKPISDKKAIELKEYRIVRDAYLKTNHTCEVEGCNSKEVELHHKKSRSSHLSNVSVFMSVCRTHHRKIHDNHQWAVDNGYLLSSLS